MFKFEAIVATVVTIFLGTSNAFWRLECDGSVALARLDPLMSPGEASNHVHSVKGGSGFSSTSNAADLLNSNCTSCGVAQDLSAYWAPAMYFMHSDGTVEVVPERPPHKTYYLPRAGLTSSGQQQKVEPFPTGFQMIAGDNFKRNSSLPNPDPNPLGPWPDESQEQRAQRAIGFNCLHYAAGNDEPSLMRHEMPTKDFIDATCTDGIRLELFFPSCWNGQLDSSPSHKSHVVYPDGVQTGNCPEGYDRRLVSLFYETIVATDHFKGQAGQFVLANGDPTGYGYHGDFIAAWKDKSLDAALEACGDQLMSGDMRECSVFTMTQNSDQCQASAPLPASIQKEAVKGPMKGLANGLQVYYGPAPAPAPVPASGSKSSSPPSPASLVSGDQNSVPTATFSGPKEPLNTNLPAEPQIGEAHEKIVVKSTTSSVGSTLNTQSPSVVRTRTLTQVGTPQASQSGLPSSGEKGNAHVLSTSTSLLTNTITTTLAPPANGTGSASPVEAGPAAVVVEVIEVVEEVLVVFVAGDGSASGANANMALHRRGHGMHGHGHGHSHHHRHLRR